MALPYAFSNNTSPTGGQLDADLAAIAALGILDGTVTGTNALAFTQGANQPIVSVYTNNQKFAFTAVANSTTSVTLQVAALAALPVYLPTGVQAGNGSIANGSYYVVTYLSALNSGLGGFVIISAVPGAVTAPVLLGSAQGLLVKNNNSVPNTSVDISARVAILQTTGGTPLYVAAPSVTCDLTTTGANGMSSDGARPTSGWVYFYLISTGSGVASLGCINPPSSALPTFPGGYSYFLYVGAMWCNGSRNLFGTRQNGRRTAVLPAVAGTGSNVPTTTTASATLTAITISSWVPATAGTIYLTLYNASSATNYIHSDNTPTIGGTLGATQLCTSSGASTLVTQGSLILESITTIYAACNGGTLNLFGTGWEDCYVNA